MDVDSEEKPKQRLSQGKKLERDRDEVEVEDFAMDVDDDNVKLDGLKLERERRKNRIIHVRLSPFPHLPSSFPTLRPFTTHTNSLAQPGSSESG
jgi:hypothetical protein